MDGSLMTEGRPRKCSRDDLKFPRCGTTNCLKIKATLVALIIKYQSPIATMDTDPNDMHYASCSPNKFRQQSPSDIPQIFPPYSPQTNISSISHSCKDNGFTNKTGLEFTIMEMHQAWLGSVIAMRLQCIGNTNLEPGYCRS